MSICVGGKARNPLKSGRKPPEANTNRGLAASRHRPNADQKVRAPSGSEGRAAGGLRRLEAENFAVEGELGFEGLDDVPGLAEAVLFAFEQVVLDADALGAERLDHRLGLVGRHDAVFVALEEDDGA